MRLLSAAAEAYNSITCIVEAKIEIEKCVQQLNVNSCWVDWKQRWSLYLEILCVAFQQKCWILLETFECSTLKIIVAYILLYLIHLQRAEVKGRRGGNSFDKKKIIAAYIFAFTWLWKTAAAALDKSKMTKARRHEGSDEQGFPRQPYGKLKKMSRDGDRSTFNINSKWWSLIYLKTRSGA
jgi:hypothetical protein